MPSHPAPQEHILDWGDVFCRGWVIAGTTGDLLCTASMAKDSRGWRGHREGRLGRSSRKSHCQTHGPAWCHLKVNQGTLTQGKDTFSGRKSLQDQDKQGLAAPHTSGFPERQLVLSPGDATGRERHGQVAAGLGTKQEGLDSLLLK